MAKVSFDTAVSNMNNDTNNGNSVGFFTLKNDGDEAIVRIMHDSVDDFDIVSLHPVNLGGKFRTVNCIREPREPIDNCPLCKNGTKIQSKIFIHMIQYTVTPEGKIEAKPVVWERSISYATKLKNDIDEYGPLSNCIFKIKRNGKPGDMQTTYDMKLGNPNMYNEASYPKIEGAFTNYTACGTVVMNKNYDELVTFVTTGAFPEKPQNNTNTTVSNVPPRAAMDVIVDDEPQTNRAPWDPTPGTNTYTTPNRPTRYY